MEDGEEWESLRRKEGHIGAVGSRVQAVNVQLRGAPVEQSSSLWNKW